jgi:hypothetical protein
MAAMLFAGGLALGVLEGIALGAVPVLSCS